MVKKFAEYAEDFENLIVPVICLYEVYKIVIVQRDEISAKIATDFMRNGKVIEIDIEIALMTVQLSLNYKLPMADSLIYATSRIYKSKLITQDIDFKCLENVDYYEKK